MKRYVVPLLLMTVVMLAATGFKIKDRHPAYPCHCFYGYVHETSGQAAAGVRVRLIQPDDVQGNTMTDANGYYRFCPSGLTWPPGDYLITTRCCEEWRPPPEGDSTRVDFVVPCACR